VDFRILGPLEVHSGSRAVALGGTKPRALLAVLLMHPNEPVHAERLALALWGEDAPSSAAKTVQVYVSRLRKAFDDPNTLSTTPGGYCLRVRADELDAERFARLVEDGRQALAAGDAEHAAAVLREALALWRGPPLADFTFEPFAQAEIARLQEQRLAAVEARVEADLAAGQHPVLVGELRQLVAANPTRERLAGQLMLALYRCGQQADALEAYHATRRVLEEIGVQPAPELRRLQEAILRQDASLEPPAGVAALAQELDAATEPPLAGRDAELAWLRERWEQVRAGRGAVATVTGEPGIGKSRLASELAGEVHRLGAVVLYANGAGPAEEALAAIARALEATRPALLVVDDADQAGADVLAELERLTGALADVPVLVLAITEDAGALAGREADSTLALGPLDAQAVGMIATLYAPGHAGEDVPAGWLSEASGGIPRRVHELAREWARREAARRVGAAAERTATGRAELRSMESELAGDVIELQATGDRGAPSDDATLVVCPFKGLASFDVADAPYFFGRERLVAELVARLVGAPLLGVVGPSGSGKSSVTRAGLLPALASGVLPGSDTWAQALIRPGEHPLRALNDAMAQIADAERVVLAVDQFEETFTTCEDEAERAAFIAQLAAMAEEVEGHCVVVIALRADYYGRCAAYPELAAQLAANHVLVRSMQRDELRRAIELPARRVGLQVDPELAEALVADVKDEPGALPLLSTALLELWQRRDGRRLRYTVYEQTGGVDGAVARLAEEAFGELDDQQQVVARGVLMRLAGEGAAGGVERRRVALAELEADRNEDVARIVALLTDRRLLTVSSGTIELAHEALMREWPRLRDWIDADREGLRIHRNLNAAAREWEELGRDDGALYRGARLTEATEWNEAQQPRLNETERAFLAACEAARERDRAMRRHRVTVALGSLSFGIVAITTIAVVALNQRHGAVRLRNIAISRELALQSANALGVDPELSVRLALLALDRSQTDQAAAALRQATLADRHLTVLPADPQDANTADYSPNGDRVVTGGTTGRVLVWAVATRHRVAYLAAGHGGVLAARYAPGGERIVLGFEDGAVVVTDGMLADAHLVLRADAHGGVHSVAFSGDGEHIAAALDDGTVRLLAADGSNPRTLSGHRGPVLGVDVDADGSRAVSAGMDGTIRLWEASDGWTERVLHRGSKPQTAVAFSPDGRRILGVGRDGWIRLWNARSGAQETRVNGEGRELLAAAFSRDGRRFAAGGTDGVTRVWSMIGGPPVAVLRGQRSRVFDVGFGRASDRVITAGEDGSVRTWDAGRTQLWTVSSSATLDIDFNHDGRRIASASRDGTVRSWDTATGRLQRSLPGPNGYTTARFSPTTDEILIGSDPRRSVAIWPITADAARIVAKVPPAGLGLNAARFDDTGDRIVYADNARGIAVRDLTSGRERTHVTVAENETVVDAQLSPDGEHLAAATKAGKILVWRLDRPARPEHVLEGPDHALLNALAYSSDGRIVTAGADRVVRIWDPAGRPSLVLQGHVDEVTTVLFTSDGSKVLSSSQDGTLRLWDARTGAALAVLQSGEGETYDVALSRDGRIATLGKGEVVRVFRCDVCGSVEQVRAMALARAPRPLTAQERKQFLAAAG
jgi:WD40 repeat protein/DNA-binding SARP family transcriptional activator